MRSERLQQLLAQLESEPVGPERLALLDRAITEAVRAGDEEAGFELRENLLLSCVMIGRLDKCIPAIEWCLARCDAEPERFDIRRVLFQYKWVIEELPRHSVYSRETIAGAVDDLEARYGAIGWGSRGPALVRMLTALTMADTEEAGVHYKAWRALPRDAGADCEACEVGHDVRYRLAVEDFAGAIEAAGPLLEGGLKCEEEPGLTLSRIPVAFVATHEYERAMEAARSALDLIVEGHQFCEARARILQILLGSGNFEGAVRLLEISFPQAVHGGNELSLLQTCIVGVPIIEVARKRRLDLPTFDGVLDGVGPDAEAVRAWMVGEAERLVPAFDERNGNDFYAQFWGHAKGLGERIPEED